MIQSSGVLGRPNMQPGAVRQAYGVSRRKSKEFRMGVYDDLPNGGK